MLTENAIFLAAQDLFKQGKYKKAFLKLIQISPHFSNDSQFLRLLSDVQMAIKDYSAQLKTLKVLASRSESVDDKVKYMICLYINRDFEESVNQSVLLLNKPVSLEQKVMIFKNLMKIYIEIGEFESLKDTCQQLEVLGAHDAEVEYARALIKTAQNDFEGALENLRQSVFLDSRFDQGWTALALNHYLKGDVSLAKANLERALDVNPQNATALKYLAQWAQDTQDEVQRVSEKLNFYLQVHNFDDEITQCHAQILEKRGMAQFAELEKEKLKYYFGSQISL